MCYRWLVLTSSLHRGRILVDLTEWMFVLVGLLTSSLIALETYSTFLGGAVNDATHINPLFLSTWHSMMSSTQRVVVAQVFIGKELEEKDIVIGAANNCEKDLKTDRMHIT